MRTVRKAELRDLPKLILMFCQLTEHLENHGQWLYNTDKKEFNNGIVGFILGNMHLENHVIFVSANEQDEAQAMLIGRVIVMSPIFQHKVLGEVQWMFPFAWEVRHVVKAFDLWAKEKGATARSCYAVPGNIMSTKIMERDGMKLGFNNYFKSYDQGE